LKGIIDRKKTLALEVFHHSRDIENTPSLELNMSVSSDSRLIKTRISTARSSERAKNHSYVLANDEEDVKDKKHLAGCFDSAWLRGLYIYLNETALFVGGDSAKKHNDGNSNGVRLSTLPSRCRNLQKEISFMEKISAVY